MGFYVKDEDKTRDQLIAELAGLRQSVDVLQKSEAKFRALFEQAGDYVLLLEVTEERDLVVADANIAALDIHGRTREEFLGTSVRDLDRGLSEQQVHSLVDRVISGERLLFETAHVRKDGTVFPVEVSTSLVDTGEDPPLVISVERDLTERRRADENLQENEAQKLAILNGITANIALVNEDLEILWANNAAAASVSRSPEEMRGHKCYEFWANPERPCEGCPTLRAFKSQQSESATMRTPDGRIWQESGEPVFATDGRLLGVVEIANDITELKKAEEALRDSERLYRGAIEANGAVVLYQDCRTGAYEFISDGILDLTGYTAEEFSLDVWRSMVREKVPVGKLAGLTPDEAVGMARYDGHWQFEVRIRIRGGEERWVANTAVYARDEHGQIHHSLGTLFDITERKRLEAELRRAHNLESLGTLAGGIAHDFNNVLTGVTGNLALLERMLGKGSEEYEIAAEAKASAERTRDLARQLMAFARGGAPVKAATSVEDLVRETTDLSLRGSNTKPYYLFAQGLWPVDIDRGQIAQVIQNLVLNADQAMPDGGALKISADNVEVAAGDPLPLRAGRYVVVTVEDEGIGMPEGVLERIFDPYYTTKEKGHGLGLSIVHRIITNHGGHIAVSSEPGVGTELVFHLPAAVKQVVETVEEKGESVGGTGHILVMDDEETVRRTTGRMLTMLGYEAAFAADGHQALQAWRAAKEAGSPYDLVMMDLTIPGGMGGKEAVVKLHEIDPAARVIVASGYDSDPVLADPQAYGFEAGIRKPIDLDELAATLQGLLGTGCLRPGHEGERP
jgi:PAS domain S-box-containing protein